MRYHLESVDKPHLQAQFLLKSVLEKLASLLPLDNAFFEIYLVPDDFNVHSYEPVPDFPRPDLSVGEYYLGEIHLNPDKIAANGEDLVFMLVHGLLHLLGYDHKNESDKIKMEQKESELLAALGYSI
jgi:rRNA maturation RNase YbeY